MCAHTLEMAVLLARPSFQLPDGMPCPVQIPIRLLDFLADLLGPGLNDFFQIAHPLDGSTLFFVIPGQTIFQLLYSLSKQLHFLSVYWWLDGPVVEAGKMATLARGAGHGFVQGEVDASTAVAFDLGHHHDVAAITMREVGLVDVGYGSRHQGRRSARRHFWQVYVSRGRTVGDLIQGQCVLSPGNGISCVRRKAYTCSPLSW